MPAREHLIVGVHITDRVQTVPDVQGILTEYGYHIRTRIGLHDVEGSCCAPGGLVLLDMIGEERACQEMIAKLKAIAGVGVQPMTFGR